ncbi:MAG: hypothetical protein RIE86_10180 [Imperialibacter sp.]|uniref:hypothetical protein n=1 Tax=Imperialibacter sp. TaxID=2038411 RepID=UPI0032F00CA0
MDRFSLLLICLVVFGCQKPENEVKSKMDAFFELNRSSQKFVIQGDSINTLITERGAIIEISSNQLSATTAAPIEVVISEVYDKSDMIYWGLSTNTSDGLYLESEGMLNIEFYAGNSPIRLSKGEKLTIKFPRSESLYNYNVYLGSSKNNITQWNLSNIVRTDTFVYQTAREVRFDYGGNGAILNTYYISRNDTLYASREVLDPGDEQFDSVKDSITIPSYLRESIYFMFDFSELDWINIDKLMESDSTETLIVKSDTSFQQKHFLIFKDRNSVLSSYPEPRLVFDKIPLHENLELISITERNDTLMYSHLEFKLDSLIELTAKYMPISKEELKMVIQGVNKKRS